MPTLKEVRAPYTINEKSDVLEHEAIIVRRDGESVVIVPMTEGHIDETVLTTSEGEMVGALIPPNEYTSYRRWKESKTPKALPVDPEFEKQWQAFQRLKPELLKKYKGQWVAIVNEEVVEVGPDFATVAERTDRFGNVAKCIGEVLEKPRVYHLPSPKVIRRL